MFKKSMAEYFLEEDQTLEKWSSIEESLKLKIGNCLILPNELKIVLSSLVDPMGGRIKQIIQHMYSNDYLPSNFMRILRWTLLCGTIDAKKTAESAIKDDNLPVTKRYEIACIYCLKEEIMLWSELSETSKDEYLNPRRPVCALRYLAMYWTYSMRLELNRLDRRIREDLNAQPPLLKS
ncbi:hypothetical protein TNIN_442101 [Trichonephila inaurata madagascariensis]|uniref:Uncharacterized protein n=1 Tax=Trichonephila inaurata madagascariensis TaxID=2747483 RepID=A0A8X6XCV9_9ARAC|nr:hypothetical protein TNIN_442101 [Trichonephila inaurata madagascariensis]